MGWGRWESGARHRRSIPPAVASTVVGMVGTGGLSLFGGAAITRPDRAKWGHVGRDTMTVLNCTVEGRGMDGGQFDDISRKLAGRTTRRDAVRRGGFLAAVGGAFGVHSVAQAQDTSNQTFKCEWGLKALVVEGPNKDKTFEGLLDVTIERDGAIDTATLETDEPKTFKVVGNTRGKAISLRIKLSNTEALALTGVGERDVKSCQGKISGTMAGPEFGDIGVFEIVRRVQPGGTAPPAASATATAGSGGTITQTPGGGGG